MEFPEPPKVSLWTSFRKRGKGGEIPRIEARAARIPTACGDYAKVCGFPGADPLPITWPGVATVGLQLAVMTSPGFPLPVVGIVHTRQRITRYRHLHAEELAASCVVEGHRVVRSGGEFDLVVQVRAGEELVWEGVSTILSKVIRGTGGERSEPPAERPWTVARSTVWRLPADQGWRYAAVSGDYNPIHLSPWTSRLLGFPRPIAHGWWALGRAMAELDADLPERVRIDARFVGTLPLPGTVRFSAGPVDEGMCAAGAFSPGSWRFEVSGRKPGIVGTLMPLGLNAAGLNTAGLDTAGLDTVR